MLIEFRFDNYLSFKEENLFSMVGVPSFKEHEPDNVFQLPDFKILKTAALYGNNASGKSNFLRAFGKMKSLVVNSFRDALTENNLQNEFANHFLLSPECEEKPILFEVLFIQEKTRFRYGFKIGKDGVVAEWLFANLAKKETPLFERNENAFKINKTSFSEGTSLTKKTRKNVLFLSLVAQFNGLFSNMVVAWFKNINFISGLFDKSYSYFTLNKLKDDPVFNQWISQFICSLEISNLTVNEVEQDFKELEKLTSAVKEEKFRRFISAFSDLGSTTTKKKPILSTWHSRYDANNILVDSIPFDLEKQESEGTKKLIYLLGPLFDTLKNGKLLIIDELDSRLHSILLATLVSMFHLFNKRGAQLIFSSHDISLLDKDFLRRDQIWFAEKDQFGVSKIYSLSDFKTDQVRKTSSYYKKYLEGRFGAISYFSIDEQNMDLVYGKK